MKFNMWKFNILMLSLLLGFAISLQVKNVKGDYLYVPLKTIHDLKISIERDRKEIENLNSLKLEMKERIKQYTSIREQDGDIKESMLTELMNQRMISGFLDVEGPGIILVVGDGTRDLFEGERRDAVLVHNIDILNVINDLKVAGAEAISVNDQRLIPTSEISCAGYTIRINNQVFAQPFIIKAIGEPKTLEAAINAPISYGQYLKEVVGLYIEVNTVLNMKIPKYSEELNYKYLKVTEEGE